jgi:hypothetical protein
LEFAPFGWRQTPADEKWLRDFLFDDARECDEEIFFAGKINTK